MTKEEAAFVSAMGQFLATYGMTPMAGRLWGYLLICDPPEQTSEEIAGALHASRGAISGTVRLLEPIGEWNTMQIKMVGTRVWVTLNGTPVVVGQVLDNFFERTQPVLPTGSIELQTHGSEVRFRNVYVREITEKEGKTLLATVSR